MRVLLIFLLSWQLWGQELMQKIEAIVGAQTFDANREIFHTLFSKKKRYYRDGRVDYLKVAQVLEKTNLLPKEYPSPIEQRILFSCDVSKPILAMKIVDLALKKAGIFGVSIVSVQRSQEFEEELSLLSKEAFPLSHLLRALRALGVKILFIEQKEHHWHFWIDVDFATLPAKQAGLPKKFSHLLAPLWMDVARLHAIRILSLSSSWYPQIFIYDEALRPLGVVEDDLKGKKILFSLPKGSRYIKIADKFTIKNMKRGFLIEGF